MTVEPLSDEQAEDIRVLLRHCSDIVELLGSDLSADEILNTLAARLEVIESDDLGLLNPLLLLPMEAWEDSRLGASVEKTPAFTPEEKQELRELQASIREHEHRLWEVLRPAFAMVTEGRNRWARRIVERRIDLATGLPMLRITVMSADEEEREVFDTEECTHAFIRNATGLLYSVAESYRECKTYGHELPKFLKAKDQWALAEALKVLRSICRESDIDFEQVLEQSEEEPSPQ